MSNTLLPTQLEGVEFLKGKLPISQYEHRWLAYEPGTGKTPITCQTIADLNLSSGVIVCPDPAAVKFQWLNHLVDWAGIDPATIQIIWTGKDQIRPDADWIIVGYALVIKPAILDQIYNHRFYDVLVIDEAKRLKTLVSLRCRGVLGKPAPLIERAQRLYFLDGTPMPNRTAELYPVLATAAREVIAPYTTYDDFGKQFCGGWNARGEDGNFRGNSNTDELAIRLRPFMLRKTMLEVFGFEPDVVEEDLFIDVEITDENGYLIDETNCHLATLRKRIGICKVPFIVEYLSYAKAELESDGEPAKILVFTYHRDVTDDVWFALNRDHPGSAVKHYGGMSNKLKEISLSAFKSDPAVAFMIAQVNSAGEALDGLQYACNTIVRAEPDWSHGLYEQNLGRVKRWGQTKAIHDLTLPAKGTLDERVVQSRRKRKRIAYRLLDNREKVIPVMKEEETTMSLEQAIAENTAAVKALTAILINNAPVQAPAGQAEAPKETAAQKKAREKAEKEAADAAAKSATSQPETTAATLPEVTEEQVREAAGAAHGACLARGMSEDATMNAVRGVTKVIGFENLSAVLAIADAKLKNTHLNKLLELYGRLEKGEAEAAPAAKGGLDI